MECNECQRQMGEDAGDCYSCVMKADTYWGNLADELRDKNKALKAEIEELKKEASKPLVEFGDYDPVEGEVRKGAVVCGDCGCDRFEDGDYAPGPCIECGSKNTKYDGLESDFDPTCVMIFKTKKENPDNGTKEQ